MVQESVRIILLNQKNEIGLIQADDASLKDNSGKYNGKFWYLIGGKIEANETLQTAAQRELYEETSLQPQDVTWGPIVWEGIVHLQKNNAPLNIHQSFIVANTHNNNIHLHQLDAWEQNHVKQLRWFSLEDITHCTEIIYPVVLKDLLPAILQKQYPTTPITIDLDKKPNFTNLS